jgi:hypothetical protein
LPSSLPVAEVLWFEESWDWGLSLPAMLFWSVGFGPKIAKAKQVSGISYSVSRLRHIIAEQKSGVHMPSKHIAQQFSPHTNQEKNNQEQKKILHLRWKAKTCYFYWKKKSSKRNANHYKQRWRNFLFQWRLQRTQETDFNTKNLKGSKQWKKHNLFITEKCNTDQL